MRSICHFILLCLLSWPPGLVAQETEIPLEWTVGYMDSENEEPDKFIPARVPGAVQVDLMRAENHSDWQVSDRYKRYQKYEDKYWKYQSTFKRPDKQNGESVEFYSEGIDYRFKIRLNGEVLHEQEGMFTPVRLRLDAYIADENTLEVIIFPIPKDPTAPFGRSQARTSVKPPVPYGWDWHPRLVPVGIWDATGIRVIPTSRIVRHDMSYTLSDDYTTAHLTYSIATTTQQPHPYRYRLLNAEGQTMVDHRSSTHNGEAIIREELTGIELWWPYDHGTPYRYTSVFELKDANGHVLDRREQKIGFRTTRLVMNKGTWEEPEGFPKTRSAPPFTLEINGRRVFAKGSNWVHPEVFYGTIDYNRYLEQVLLAKAANFNILRVWGGGIVNKEAFHDICDSLGIMVWQEFPLACNDYPDEPHFLQILEQEARSIIHRMKQHPSTVIWSGGNELFNRWSGMTDQSHALRLLNSLCYRLDPNTPFIPTSPVMGVAHGHYLFFDPETGEEVYQLMDRAHHTAYTEFGMPGLSPVETIKRVIPREDLFPPQPGTAWEEHHAFGAWRPSSWLEPNTLERYFGKATSVEELVQQSQLLQSEGYKAIYESARRQKPYCSMAVNWCFNEPWSTAINNSLVAWPNIPKPALHAVGNSCRPTLSSAVIEKFGYQGGETLELELWMLHDAYETVGEQQVQVYVTLNDEKMRIGGWQVSGLAANENLQGPTLRYKLPAGLEKQLIQVNLEVKNKPEWNSSYRLLYQGSPPSKPLVYGLNQ